MKEISLNILDIANNSIRAGATRIAIAIETDRCGMMTVTVTDNGCGMDTTALERSTDPFYTTKQGKTVGLGLPFYKMAAELTGGRLTVSSRPEEGTEVRAVFDTRSIDCMPMGDIVSTVCALISGSPATDIEFTDITPHRMVALDTVEIKKELSGVSPAEPAVLNWISEYLREQYSQ